MTNNLSIFSLVILAIILFLLNILFVQAINYLINIIAFLVFFSLNRMYAGTMY